MDDARFITAYRESRNGTENFYFNKMVPNFYYSDQLLREALLKQADRQENLSCNAAVAHESAQLMRKAAAALAQPAEGGDPLGYIPTDAIDQIKTWPRIITNKVPVLSYAAEGYTAIYTAPPASQEQAQQPQAQAIKDNEIAQLVNRLRDIAIEFRDQQQLRERIAMLLVPILKATQARDARSQPQAQELPDERASPLDEFKHWLNDRRACDVSFVFHEIVAKYSAVLAAKPVSTPVNPQIPYAWPSIKDYEKDIGFPTSDGFRMGWNMARTTNEFLKKITGG